MDVITFASFPIPTVWGTSEERPRNLLDVWPALCERTSDVLQRVRSHTAHTLAGEKSFVHAQNFFHSLACENESGQVRTFAKRVQCWQNVTDVCRACDDVWQNFTTRWTHVKATRLGVTAALGDGHLQPCGNVL